MHVAGSRWQAVGSRQQAAGSRQHVEGSTWQAIGGRWKEERSRQGGSWQKEVGWLAGSRQHGIAPGNRKKAVGSSQQVICSRPRDSEIAASPCLKISTL